MKVDSSGSTLRVDLHGMRVEQARFRLETLIGSCGENVREIVVIHGFNAGTALRDMVRSIDSPRIKSVVPAYNEGQTVITLRKKK